MKAGVYLKGTFLLDYNGNGIWDGPAVDKLFTFNPSLNSGAVPVVGDWNGDGKTKVGVFYNGSFYVDYVGDFAWIDQIGHGRSMFLGGPGYTPMIGDWNGNGKSKLGAFSAGTWFIDYNGDYIWNPSEDPLADKLFYLGGTGYTPMVGDWNGDGHSKVAVYKDGLWLIDQNGNFAWDLAGGDLIVYWGNPGFTPIVGDWNGGGSDKIGAYSDGVWIIDYNGDYTWQAPGNSPPGDGRDGIVFWGGAGQKPLSGKW